MNLDQYKNPITTKEDINDLHKILVKTVLNFMKERKLSDIYEVDFLATGLTDSYDYNEWTPGTDSSLYVVGVQEEEDAKIGVRRMIGYSM